MEPLRRVEEHFPSSIRDHNLCAIRWEFAAPAWTHLSPRGVCLISHGYGHYAAPIYDWLAATLARRGIACVALEHIGHGKSSGLRGYVPSFDALVGDVLAFAATVRARLPPRTPFFLYGESLGGAIAQHAALRAPSGFSGLVLFAPMTELASRVEPPWPLVALGRVVAWLAPAAALAPVTDVTPLCFRDTSMIETVRADPHRYAGRLRLRTGFELKAAMETLAARGADLSAPLLLLHGTGDIVTSHAASERLFERCASRDKTLLLYEGAYHSLWAEPVDTRARLLEDVCGWLEDRCDEARRGALAAEMPIAAKRARPLGVGPFRGPPGDETTPFTAATHGHLYTAQKPERAMERASEAAVQATLADTPPRIGLAAQTSGEAAAVGER